MKYVNLVIDNKSDTTDSFYTYGCEFDEISVGNKVYVSFGRSKKLKEAYVFEVMDGVDDEIKNLKYVVKIDEEICLNTEMIDTCTWMKRRYLCRYIDAVKMFVPSGRGLKNGKLRKPLENIIGEVSDIERLNQGQKDVIKDLRESSGFDIFLLHGVTGSGKTEVYMQIIESVIKDGKKAIMTVPEISLTKQITDRFVGRFGNDRIAVLHSRLSPGERHDEWMKIRRGEVDIVIGARSAIFAPLENIGIIVMDEEHDGSYKSDMTPKYETVDIAAKRCKNMSAPLILGSATPGVVSYHRALQGVYKKLTLTERYNYNELPYVETVDMREELRSGNRSILSNKLFQEINDTLSDDKQVILLLNRRGYSTFISCRDCGYVLKCDDCDISLTYHKESNACICHYCGKTMPLPAVCPECGSRYIRHFGVGTEKLEEEIKKYFPYINTERLDFDSTKRKGSLEKILDRFGKGKTRILTGTQIVAKGLDFRNVGLVGIIAADITLNIPDFRSGERTFQLITQAAGRAGRGDEKGKVIVQTYTPENYVIKAAAKHDYKEFFDREIVFRKACGYPPFSDIIQITFSGKDETYVISTADKWYETLKRKLNNTENSILPHSGFKVGGKKEEYREYILIKCPAGMRNRYLYMIAVLREKTKNNKNISVSVDVNPNKIWRN